MGSIFNIGTAKADAAVNGGGNLTPVASGSMPGESNEFHAAGLVLAVALIVVVAGLINVNLGVGIGKGE